MDPVKEKLRIDKYLWAIRIFKTRSMAAEACDKGKVKAHGDNVKASRNVHVEDEYEIKTEARLWVIKVTGLLQQRVQYSEAVKYYLDLTPEGEPRKPAYQATSFYTGKRLSKVGRPTKKQRRDMNEFMGDE